MTRKQIEKAAEEAGWNVTIGKRDDGGYDIDFQMYTDFGQDRNEPFYVQKLEDIKSEVYDRYQNFDPSEEAALWIDESGHGKNGAPHDMEDILDDMKEVEKALENLSLTLCGNKLSDPNKVDFAREANNLRDRCLMELLSNIHRARQSRWFTSDVKGFDNPDKCSKYEEVVYLESRWTLIDGDGLQYSINVMPLEDICEMVDAIINGKE